MPIVVGGAIFAAGCALLVWWLHGRALLEFSVAGRRLELGEPRALYLLCLIPWVFVTLRASLVDLGRGQQITGGVLRSLLVVALATALAQPSTIGERQTVCTVLLVDVSDSMGARQLEAARALVDEARRERRDADQLKLVTFAKHPRLIALPADGAPLPAEALQRHARGGDTSDLAAALSFAYGLYPGGTIRRAVLISDGNQTAGNVMAEAQAAARRGIHVDVHSLGAALEDEVLVRELRLPDDAKIGQPFEVSADLFAARPSDVIVTLYRDEFVNPLDGRKTLHLDAGRNVVRWRSEVTQAGVTNFRVELSGKFPDHFAANNRAQASLAVRGKPRVLYLEGELASSRYLANALGRENIDVEVRGPYGLPTTPRELGRYDLVLMSDVPAMYVGAAQQTAIESYVRDLGGGFIMTGGEASFGSGGYAGTRMETFLPLRFETEKKKDQPQLAMVLCIDKSGSMSAENKMELAKEAARVTAGVLGPDDLLGVIGFDSVPTHVVRLQRAANRTSIQRLISSMQAGGGTNILLPLKAAYDDLLPAQAKIKHVIFLTDGIAAYEGVSELVDEMAAHKITVSAVGVGGEADKTMLTTIAEHGGGRFYHTMDASNIPRIFTKETQQVARSTLIEEAIGIRVVRGAELLANVGIESAPALRGYVSTKPKPLSEVILETTRGEPLLARWRQGTGQVMAFTSDVKNRWAIDWLRWPGYAKLWAQLVRSTMRHQLGSGGGLPGASFELRADVDPPRARVTLDGIAGDDRFLSGLDVSLQIIDPSHPTAAPRTRAMQPTASGRYEANIELDRYGSLVLRAVAKLPSGQVAGEASTTLSLPYAREYLALPPDEALLGRVAAISGGQVAPHGRAWFDAAGEKVKFSRDLWTWAAWLALLLLLADVAVRRIRMY